ncbi:hypothetical protein BY458DRAFT_490850 [Sporodiniella umbellata]|nr:hypothetical protein BY458DRAFT_490850 [Sporodiniella umbellata]
MGLLRLCPLKLFYFPYLLTLELNYSSTSELGCIHKIRGSSSSRKHLRNIFKFDYIFSVNWVLSSHCSLILEARFLAFKRSYKDSQLEVCTATLWVLILLYWNYIFEHYLRQNTMGSVSKVYFVTAL